MRYQINSFDYLKNAISGLLENPEQWRDYPCVIWERGKSMGYGSLGTNKGGSTYAHWMAYELAYGPIPDGCRVRHKCGVHACFRPSHLFAHSDFVFFNDSLPEAIDASIPWTDYACLLWPFTKGGHGYGEITTPDGRDLAHRLSYRRFHGATPAGMEVCHRCDVRACYHPAHLFLGTRQDNVDDMIQKGRNTSRKGEAASKAKLTNEQVIEIRRLHATGINHCRLAEMFPVDRSTIGNIVRRKLWKHI